MASAILYIDLEHLPEEITGLSAYGRALVLVRVRGRAVAQVTVPVHEDCSVKLNWLTLS